MATDIDISNIKEDIKEMTRLLKVAKRPKVESRLTVWLRGLETELKELLNEKNLKEAQINTKIAPEDVRNCSGGTKHNASQ